MCAHIARKKIRHLMTEFVYLELWEAEDCKHGTGMVRIFFLEGDVYSSYVV